MNEVREQVADLLEEKPHLRSGLRDVLEVDADGPWEFDDVPLDSGEFGEVVSRSIVENVEGGYRVADRAAVASELADGPADGADAVQDEAVAPESATFELPLPASVSHRVVVAVLGLVVLLIAVRVVFSLSDIYRDGAIVLAGNDPYGYRYWVEQLLARDVGMLDLSRLSEVFGDGLSRDYLYLVTVWWASILLGGTPKAAGHTLAWFPVGIAVLTGVVVYCIAVRTSRDRRVGVAALAFFALTPVHAYRSMIGFGDHHAFDYFWLALTVLSLVFLARDRLPIAIGEGGPTVSVSDSWGVWLGTAGLGVGVAGQILAWRGGALLLPPILLYASYRAISDPRAGESPLIDNLPLVAGLALASVLCVGPSLVWNWPSPIRALVPGFMLALSLIVLLLGDVAFRYDLSVRVRTAVVLCVPLVVGLGLVAVSPVSVYLNEGFQYFSQTGSGSIAETVSLFDESIGGLLGPILFFSFILFLAVPYVGVGLWRVYRDHDPVWFVLVSYGLFLMTLSLVQLRFAGPLAIPVAVIGGASFLHLLSWLDLADWRFDAGVADGDEVSSGYVDLTPLSSVSNRKAVYVVVAFLLVTSLSFVQIPIKQHQLTVDSETYEAATWIDSYSQAQGIPDDQNYVFSAWSQNRVYNYFVSGNSKSYVFAQDNFGPFLVGTDPERWYDRLASNGTGFIVTGPTSDIDRQSMAARLHMRFQGEGPAVQRTSHYRTVYVNEDLSKVVTMLVPGATLVGTGEPGANVTVTGNFTIDDERITYERVGTVNPYGIYSVTVPYVGSYTVDGRRANVTERAVLTGRQYLDHNRDGIAHWPFDTNATDIAYDRVGGYRGVIKGPTKRQGVQGLAVLFDDGPERIESGGHVTIPANESFTLTFWIRGNLTNATDQFADILRVGSSRGSEGFGVWARPATSDLGARFNGENGQNAFNFGLDRIDFRDWTQVAVVLDRDEGVLELYRNGTRVSETPLSGLGRVEGRTITVGEGLGSGPARILIDEVRMYDRALDAAALQGATDDLAAE